MRSDWFTMTCLSGSLPEVVFLFSAGQWKSTLITVVCCFINKSFDWFGWFEYGCECVNYFSLWYVCIEFMDGNHAVDLEMKKSLCTSFRINKWQEIGFTILNCTDDET